MKSHEFGAAVWSADPESSRSLDGVVGTASFKARDGLYLDIPFGSISRLTDGTTMHFDVNGDVDGLERAYGRCQSGEFITLLDPFNLNLSYNGDGFSKEGWKAQEALVSRGGFFAEDPIVSSAEVAIDGLFEWVRDNPVKVETRRSSDGKWLTTTYSASSRSLRETVIYRCDSMEVLLSPRVVGGGGNLPLKTYSLSGDQVLIFRFAAPYPRLHEAMFDSVIPYRDFLSLLMGYRAEVLEASFKSPEVEDAIKYYAPLVATASENRPSRWLREMLFPYHVTETSLQFAAEQWLSLDPDARRASRVILGFLTGRRDSNLSSEFVTLASALEALARVGQKTQELTDEEFERRLACIEQGVLDKKTRDWARRKLKYSNFVSAGALTDKMLRELEPFTSWLVPDTGKFKSDHRMSRNAYVHRNADLGGEASLEDKDLLTHTDATFLLAYAKLMSLLGWSPAELVERFKYSYYRSYKVCLIQKMYAN